ncbi:MAG: ABC-F family ATP-binding cassette domain-containing protein [Clostridia bacterium]|nr:ABC-F family ATP-binding cassette domain-containing protein [Clostridia bacterium]
MIIFNCKNICCSFADRTILENINLTVFEKDRIGIIGANGCGKTTFLKILMENDEIQYSGEITRASDVTVGYIEQSAGASDSRLTVEDEMLSVFEKLINLEQSISKAEAELRREGLSDEEQIALSGRLSRMYDEYVTKGGNTFRSRITGILKGLKFDENTCKLPVSELSGGQKTRLALGKTLLKDPDVMILDEPTNHLDLESIEWLEDALKSYNGTLLIISHDRHFLENTVNKTFIIENCEGKLYNAPYSKYTQLRKADLEYQEKCYRQQQKEIARIKDIIKTQRMWNREKNIVTAESWQKKLDRMELIDKPTQEDNLPIIDFATELRGGNEVLMLENLGFSFPDKDLFKGVNLKLMRGERLFIKGPNGCGKSTLLKIISGHLTETYGSWKLGANIVPAYYSQDFSDLNVENTLFEEIFETANYDYYHNQGGLAKFHDILSIRNSLAAFGFKGDDVFKPISTLSGGEKARIALLKITYKKSNLLILDEPTNHLDIGTCDVLEEALSRYQGTVIAVSHDRYFTEKVCTKVLDMGEYSLSGKDFADNVKRAENATASASKDAYLKDKEHKAAVRKYTKLRESLEKTLEELEEKITVLDAELQSPDNTADYAKVQSLFEEKTAAEEELSEKEMEYLECLEMLENLGE